MIKPHSCIYLVPLFPVFNEQEIKDFATFSKENSVKLYSSLYLNLLEVTNSISNLTASVFCFDEKDRNYISKDFNESQNVFFNLDDKPLMFKTLSDRYFGKFNNNLIIFTNTIKISQKEILKNLDLLNREDETLVIGKSHKAKVSYIGFNIYNQELFHQLDATDLKFDNLLHLVCRYDYFLNTLNGSLFIEDIKDFQILYKELSKKESLSYCSQNIHEKFTHLFIEYKELLKC
jgi:hypothetical protein